MKKVNTSSTQYKVIQPRKNNPNPQIFAPNPQSFANSIPNKKKLPKVRQEIVNDLAASGFKQFNL